MRSHAWGDVTFDDIDQHRKALREHPDFDETYNQLGGWTAVTSVQLSSAEVRFLANERLFAPSSRRAFVASDALSFGMMRMFQAFHELSDNAGDVMVFSDSSEALAWLNRRIAKSKLSG